MLSHISLDAHYIVNYMPSILYNIHTAYCTITKVYGYHPYVQVLPDIVNKVTKVRSDERHLQGVLVWGSKNGCSGLLPTE